MAKALRLAALLAKKACKLYIEQLAGRFFPLAPIVGQSIGKMVSMTTGPEALLMKMILKE
jgi:hypothetical protein